MKLLPSAGVLTRHLLRRCTLCLAAVAVAGRRLLQVQLQLPMQLLPRLRLACVAQCNCA
jgi:hypothetical protein